MMLQSRLELENKSGARQMRIDAELKILQESMDRLDAQEKRNKQIIGAVRGENVVVKAPPGGRKGVDFYSEANVLKQLEEKNRKLQEQEDAKLKRISELKQSNQEYLSMQIQERNRIKE